MDPFHSVAHLRGARGSAAAFVDDVGHRRDGRGGVRAM